MPLHPVVEGIRNFRVATGFTPLYTMSVEDARTADAATEATAWDWTTQPEEVFDLDIPGPAGPLTLRVYRPVTDSTGPLPVLMYFFGGGFVVGTLQTSDAFCRALSDLSGCMIVSVGYRLAPEHPFPAAPEDCYAATAWVAEHAGEFGGDGSRLAVAGDSNGGTLAAVVSLMARDRKGPEITAQVLVYPALQYGSDTASMRENVDPMFFNGISVPWFWSLYLADPADGASPYASPLNAADHSGLPAALIVTAEYCPLRDEGEAYAKALADAGTTVDFRPHADLPHGFLSMASVLPEGKQALLGVADFLRTRLA
ncbi:alpha/beta hydrolase [Kitasatospora sp. MMS16-BH015]|uniref:alpha/beta hydrolase n=1 Tax=Kitasatospora sp. MMS16-BH015 TaxID=2018025 RepID=UPI000CA10EDF|nr:alpha/beta hydrolase [Kitasatospora sp. MMS16-BH015]AUG78707.1 alpha/beta hydrolase [Kitasatospora sp. MMS16-BH015]